MAGPKGSKYYDIFLKYHVWLENIHGKDIVGNGKFELLIAIEETGSLTLAAQKLNISYRKAWGNLREIEERLGFPVVTKSRGGIIGGQTLLNSDGSNLIKAYKDFLNEIEDNMHHSAKKFWAKVNQ